MSARDRAVDVVAETLLEDFANPRGLAEEIVVDLEAAGLRVIEEPEAAYDTDAAGPLWVGEDWTVVALADGEVEVAVADDAHPGSGGHTYRFEREIVAAIHAAHVKAEDYR